MTSFYDRLNQLPAEYFRSDKVLFRLIENEADLAYVIFGCELKDDQKELVNPGSFSIGRAYLDLQNNYPCVICSAKDEKPIGFINFCRWLGKGDAVSWGYYLDKTAQGQGYGRASAGLAISALRAAFKGSMLKGAVEAGNQHAQKIYESLGLCCLNELDGDDLVFGAML